MITIDLSGKTILLTGAMGAIAEHMVRRLTTAGAFLVLLDLKPTEQALQLLREWDIASTSFVYHSIDITDSAGLTRIVDGSFERFPNLDTVLGHAGGCGLHPFATTPEAEFERIFRFNFFAQTYLTRAVFAQWLTRKIPGHIDLHLVVCGQSASHSDSFLRLRQSGAGEFRSLHGAGVRIFGDSRQCHIARKRCRRKLAESLRRGSRLSGICFARLSGKTQQPGIDCRCFGISLLSPRRRDQRSNPECRLRRRNRKSPMKVGLGLYRHMLTRDYYDFARQAGCTHVVVHLVDYFNRGPSNPRNNQPTGAKYEPWGVAGDPAKLWTVAELTALRKEIEDAGLVLAAIENLDPAHWHDILLDGPRRPQHIENVKTIVRRLGEAGIPVLGYNFSLAGVCGRVTAAAGRGGAVTARHGWPCGRRAHSERNGLEHDLRPRRAGRHVALDHARRVVAPAATIPRRRAPGC